MANRGGSNWACGACTFVNSNTKALACAICGTTRPKGSVETSAEGTCSRKLSQRTLFATPGHRVKNDNNNKKRRRDDVKNVGAVDGSVTVQKKKQDAPSAPSSAVASSGASLSSGFLLPSSDKPRFVSKDPYHVLAKQSDETMRNIFKIEKLRKLQPKVIERALKRKSSIVIMATGGGKSLCYQLPATVLGGVTIVISPLIALMVDQVNALNSKGISAALVSSSEGERKNAHVMERLVGKYNKPPPKKKNTPERPPLSPITLLYVTPESIQTGRFRNTLKEVYRMKGLALIAIDEAHCVSSWGHDFRPSFRKLDWLRRSFPDVPCMACTATATPKVIQDIRDILLFQEDDVPCLMSSFNRSNITYEVRYKDSLDVTRQLNPLSTPNELGGGRKDLTDFIAKRHKEVGDAPCSGIVYVHKRGDTSDLADTITTATGIRAAAYHAGLKDSERSLVQRQWTSGEIAVVVATVAFGMGIDLPHVRYVIHWTVPKTLEGFYQESGRGGRDGLAATSLLYYSKDDASKIGFVIRKSNKNAERALKSLQQMCDYCMQPGCRRQFVLKYFGETMDPASTCKKTCDYCKNPKKVINAIQSADVYKDTMRSMASRTGKRGAKEKWDGQWTRPFGDDDDEKKNWTDTDWTENGLAITRSAESMVDWDTTGRDPTGSKAPPGRSGFVSASAVLSKYERLEEDMADADGKRKSQSSRYSMLPEHLRKNAPDPLQHLNRKQSRSTRETKSSAQLSSEVDRLKAELQQMNKQKDAARLAALKSKKRVLAPPPPSLSFGKKRK